MNFGLVAQNTETVFPKLAILSSDSKISINKRGDTVMTSNYNSANVRQNSRNDFEKEYKGTPFFENGWYKADIQLTTNDNTKGVIAFNLLTNTVMFSQGPNYEAIEIKPMQFTINGHTFKKYTKEYTAAGQIYYERLINGQVELFKQFLCNYKPAVSGDKNGYEQTGDGYEGHFVKQNLYFTIYHNKMTEINKKFKVFDKHAKQAETFAKENNLSLKKEADLIKIVKYLNQSF